MISSCDWLALYKHLKAQVFNIILDLANMEFKYRNKIYMKENLLFVFLVVYAIVRLNPQHV